MPELLSKADKISTIAASAAMELNDEMTVILNGLAVAGRGVNMPEVQQAARRAAMTAARLLEFALSNGGRRTPASFAAMVSTVHP